uniref:Hepatic leukemia factor-like n=1 Tax=Petromyzon marinus TaxID=7757 RepID=A0AAJ7UFW6_PETMA|nr:hepatic leukemia factor-like [Petromyzon marinus]
MRHRRCQRSDLRELEAAATTTTTIAGGSDSLRLPSHRRLRGPRPRRERRRRTMSDDLARPESPFRSSVLRALLESLQQRPALLAGDADDGDDEKKLIAEAVLGMGGEGSPPGEGASPPPDSSGDHGIAASVARAAFLGPTIWDRTIPYGGNAFTLEYMDLDDFLSQEELTGLGLDGFEVATRGGSAGGGGAGGGGGGGGGDADERSRIGDRGGDVTGRSSSGGGPDNSSSLPRHPPPSPSPPSPSSTPSPSTASTKPSKDPKAIAAKKPRRLAPEGEEEEEEGEAEEGGEEVDDEVEVEFVPSPTDVALSTVPGQEPFDPRRRRFSPDELKPQPIVKKARKVYVPDDCKDEKYWQRRTKNNRAAQRSREARRFKENQIAVRAAFLESQNAALKREVAELRATLARATPSASSSS